MIFYHSNGIKCGVFDNNSVGDKRNRPENCELATRDGPSEGKCVGQ